MEKVIIGTVGKEPEVREGNMLVVKTSVSESAGKNKDGSWKPSTWWNVVAFNDVASQLANVSKGDKLIMVGRTETQEWTGKDGEKKSGLSFIVSTFGVVPAKTSSGSYQNDNTFFDSPASDEPF